MLWTKVREWFSIMDWVSVCRMVVRKHTTNTTIDQWEQILLINDAMLSTLIDQPFAQIHIYYGDGVVHTHLDRRPLAWMAIYFSIEWSSGPILEWIQIESIFCLPGELSIFGIICFSPNVPNTYFGQYRSVCVFTEKWIRFTHSQNRKVLHVLQERNTAIIAKKRKNSLTNQCFDNWIRYQSKVASKCCICMWISIPQWYRMSLLHHSLISILMILMWFQWWFIKLSRSSDYSHLFLQHSLSVGRINIAHHPNMHSSEIEPCARFVIHLWYSYYIIIMNMFVLFIFLEASSVIFHTLRIDFRVWCIFSSILDSTYSDGSDATFVLTCSSTITLRASHTHTNKI